MNAGVKAAVDQTDADHYVLTPEGDTYPQTTRADLIHAMLELLAVRPTDRVLELGTGSGYSTALLSRLAYRGCVTTLDVDAEPADRARALLSRDHRENVTVIVGDGRIGLPSAAPFDRVVAWAALDEIPPAWLEQLTDEALVVAPIHTPHGTRAILYHNAIDGLVEGADMPAGFIPSTAVPFRPWEPA